MPRQSSARRAPAAAGGEAGPANSGREASRKSQRALGLLETFGYTAAIQAADAAAKAADVAVVGYHLTRGKGWVCVKIEGEVAAVQAAVDAAKEWENLYLDLTGSALPRGVLELMVARVGAERILFGTDIPFVDIRPQIGYVVFARISDDDKRKILGLNSQRLFGFSPE